MFEEVLFSRGAKLFKRSAANDRFDGDKQIISNPGFQNAHVLSCKLHTLREELHPDDAKFIKNALSGSSKSLVLDAVNTNGVFDSIFIGKGFLHRQNAVWGGN